MKLTSLDHRLWSNFESGGGGGAHNASEASMRARNSREEGDVTTN